MVVVRNLHGKKVHLKGDTIFRRKARRLQDEGWMPQRPNNPECPHNWVFVWVLSPGCQNIAIYKQQEKKTRFKSLKRGFEISFNYLFVFPWNELLSPNSNPVLPVSWWFFDFTKTLSLFSTQIPVFNCQQQYSLNPFWLTLNRKNLI